jgi:7-carboxy-7-deazaguanine synthase
VTTLRISEIFYSLQGESTLVGLPTIFVRLTGCPLRCNYCDTEYAFTGGERLTLEQIMTQIKSYKCKTVCVTGGEPLAQKDCHQLLTLLCDEGYQVSLETSGAMAIDQVDPRVIKVLDLKTPNSGEMVRNKMENLQYITEQDQIKFVVCNRRDFEWAAMLIQEHQLANKCTVLFSPSYQELEARELAEWILADALPVRMQVQLHKHLWGEKQGV